MATIPSYPQATPGPEDLLLGINVTLEGGADAPKTRTFTVGDIVELASNGVAGPQGPQGLQGAPGIQGPPGANGAVGPAGLNWRGPWVSMVSYVEDDAVGWNGASWFCILPTAGIIVPNLDTTHWALLASQGAQGIQGVQGEQGLQGSPGIVLPIIASSPLTGGTITTTGTIGISQATTSIDGYLSSTDFAAFTNKENSANKQDSLVVDGTGTKFPTVDAVNAGIANFSYWTKTGNDIKNNNIGNVEISGTKTAVSNLAQGVIISNVLTSSANNDVLVGLDVKNTFDTGSYTGSNKNLFRVTANNILRTVIKENGAQTWYLNDGIGEVGFISYGTPNSKVGIQLFNNTSTGRSDIRHITTGGITIATGTTGSVPSNQFYFYPTGNLAINQSTDSGYRLDVNGTTRLNGIVTATALVKYNSDLSSSYDDRTLVDKGYIDNRLVSEKNNSYPLVNTDSGGIIIFTANATLTIPTGLANGFECTFVTLADVTLTVVSTGNTLNNAIGNVLPPKSSFTLKRMIAANTFIATGNL